MQYDEKLTRIRGLSEEELRKNVLVPLLNSMGFKGVREYHGPGERGKDIICYSLNNLGHREYTAVVVKTAKIHGSVGKQGSIANIVSIQVRQALNEPYVDVYGLRRLTVDKCLVITSNEIVSTCVENILGTIESYQLHRVMNFVDGNWLVQTIDEHMPTYFEERDKDEVIKEQEKRISEFKGRQYKAVEVIYDMSRAYGAPGYVSDSSAANVLSTSTEFDFNATLVSGTTAFNPYIPRSKILKRFIDEGIIPSTVKCPRCGTYNSIDPSTPFIQCGNCGRSIY